MHYVYRFINQNETVIYVGKTSQTLQQRFKTHHHFPDVCYQQVRCIEYIECQSPSETSIKEIYYINLYRNNDPYFNLLDLSEPVPDVEFHNTWHVYTGQLSPVFINAENERCGSDNSASCRVDYLDANEVERVTSRLVQRLSAPLSMKTLALHNLVFSEEFSL